MNPTFRLLDIHHVPASAPVNKKNLLRQLHSCTVYQHILVPGDNAFQNDADGVARFAGHEGVGAERSTMNVV